VGCSSRCLDDSRLEEVIATVAKRTHGQREDPKNRRIEESKKSVTLRRFAAMSHKITQEKGRKGDQGAGIISQKNAGWRDRAPRGRARH
jgi:hypothetical protein